MVTALFRAIHDYFLVSSKPKLLMYKYFRLHPYHIEKIAYPKIYCLTRQGFSLI